MNYSVSEKAISMKRGRTGGQTLIVALLILGILMILGFVFLGLISRNIASGSRANQRSIGNDLAEAGIRYAHGMLLKNTADWRVALSPGLNNRDPDFELMKPGGPDGLGNYGRVNFDQGRALVRVRYGPSDVNVYSTAPNGPLRNPGRAKNFVIIESIGKPGKANPNDPTTALDARGERERIQTRKLIAFASLGITEQAFFVTNKFRVSRAIEFGAPSGLGVRYHDDPTAAGPYPEVAIPIQIGDNQLMPNPSGGTSGLPVPFGGSMWFNGDVVFHGDITSYLNKYYGDQIVSTGTMIGADDATSALRVRGADAPAGTWAALNATLTNASGLNSNSANFSTAGGFVRDGVPSADAQGFTRGERTKEAPSFLSVDNASGETIYRSTARESGQNRGAGNSGEWGHGREVYVNNFADRQNRIDEGGRTIQETNESLTYDWLNPNNGQAGSGWQGAFYVPRGAYVQLTPDGFLILRDSAAPAGERTWKDQDGNDTTNTVNRYRIVRGPNGKLFIANSYSAFGGGSNINTATPAQVIGAGTQFDGVLYFEGNVRVRGTIPTDVQLTLISGATIYIEGSITKGVVRTQAAFDQGGPLGQRINTSSRSMLLLAAKDYVAINTSQFFGPAPTQIIEEVNDLPSASEYNPIRMRRAATPGAPSTYNFRTESLLDPSSGNPANPSQWKPFAASYQEFGTANFINAGILMTHTMDDGPATNSFISLDINYGLGATDSWRYLFDLNRTPPTPPLNIFDPYQRNNASDYNPYATVPYTEPGYGPAQQDRGPIYGLGAESWQRYSKFESTFFPVIASNGTAGAYGGFPLMPVTNEHGTYTMLAQETNEFGFRFNDIGTNPSNDYLIARAAMVPNDVRIEASVYAEEGSFFVIPSPWFNPNPNDRRDVYLARVLALGNNPAAVAQAQAERYENFGSAPITPFFGEPIDVKVRIIGAVSQNMPAPMSQQAEWLKKWGWIPRSLGDVRNGAGNTMRIPEQHVPAGYNLAADLFVPNLIISYDPALGSGRAWDPVNPSPFSPANPAIRVDDDGRMLPPMPKLPVSPTLAYFGEVNP